MRKRITREVGATNVTNAISNLARPKIYIYIYICVSRQSCFPDYHGKAVKNQAQVVGYLEERRHSRKGKGWKLQQRIPSYNECILPKKADSSDDVECSCTNWVRPSMTKRLP